VHEFFGDFVVVDPHHFAVPITRSYIAVQVLPANSAVSMADMDVEPLAYAILLQIRVLLRLQTIPYCQSCLGCVI